MKKCRSHFHFMGVICAPLVVSLSFLTANSAIAEESRLQIRMAQNLSEQPRLVLLGTVLGGNIQIALAKSKARGR